MIGKPRVKESGENNKDRQKTIKFLLVLVGLLFLGIYLHKIGTMGGPKLWVDSGAMYRSDRPGEPVGADFTLFWAASYLSLQAGESG
jgi:hypothetical protein